MQNSLAGWEAQGQKMLQYCYHTSNSKHLQKCTNNVHLSNTAHSYLEILFKIHELEIFYDISK